MTWDSSQNNLSVQASDIGILPGNDVRQMDRLFLDKPGLHWRPLMRMETIDAERAS